MTCHPLHVLTAAGEPETWQIEHGLEAPWPLALVAPDGSRYDATGRDLFDGLRQLRRQAEEAGILLCCNGARKNARPSGFSGELGALGVYKLHRWRAPLPGDLVDIFGYAPPGKIVGVEAQEAYWLKVERYRKSVLGLANPLVWMSHGYTLLSGRLRDARARRGAAPPK